MLLLKQKYDLNIIFVQYLWILGTEAQSKNLIYNATERQNLEPVQWRRIGK